MDKKQIIQNDETLEIEPALCCCEYYNHDNERFHILGCCCNCQDFDLVFDRLISCKSINENNKSGMLLTFQDRLRIPWQGGAKQISLAAIIPIPILAIIIGLAAISWTIALIIFLISTILFIYSLYYLKNNSPRTKFFFMWTFWTIIYIISIFELTVPLVEILPEENLILVLLVMVSIYSFYKCKKHANLNHIMQSTVSEDELPDITEEKISLMLDTEESDEAEHNQSNICENCRKYVQPRAFHCFVCQACVMRRDHHSFWLDCCIGECNHRYYLSGLLFGMLSLFLLSNLALTAVCHPVLLFEIASIPVLLPDDCTDVFDQYDVGLAFVGSVYALLIAGLLLFAFIWQIYLISRGVTHTEHSRGRVSNRKPIFTNWKAFFLFFN